MDTPDKTAKHADALKEILRQGGREGLFPRRLLEKYPHIIDRICQLWADPEKTSQYFTDLLTTQREQRAGFPIDIYTELFALENYYRLLHPAAQKNDQFWSGVNKRD